MTGRRTARAERSWNRPIDAGRVRRTRSAASCAQAAWSPPASNGTRAGARERQRLPEVVEAAALDRDGLDDRHAQLGREAGGVDVDAAAPGLVHHVEHEHHRQAEARDLRGEHQRAAQVARVGHLDDDVGLAGWRGGGA